MTEDKTKDSPDKDKGLELTDDKPPIMGEGQELVEGKPGEETTAPDIGKAGEEKLSPEILELMKKKGFKDLSEVAKSLESQDRKITDLESERRVQSFIPREAPPRPRVEREFTSFPELKDEPYNVTKEELDNYLKQTGKAFEERLTAKYEDAEADKKWDREYRETMAVVNKDPERFEEIKPQLRVLHNKYPDAPLGEIYPMADKMEKEQAKEKVEKLRGEILGGDIDPDKLKTLISRLRPAIVSDAGGAGATGADKTGREKAEEVIWDGIAKSDVRRE